MVRVLQPAGFGRIQLVRVGLIPDVSEVILLTSPESMSENELSRISEMARELGSKETARKFTEDARLAEEARVAEEAIREEQKAREAEVLRLAQEAHDAETMFTGQISLEQVERYQDSEAACVIRGVHELENAIISVAKNKYKVFFDPAKNRTNWSGYHITVKSTIPKEISSRENFVTDSTAYLENLKTIEHREDE